MNKFKNKYRISSTRLPHWDYRWAGTYFVTICTQNRVHYFGEMINGEMQLSNTGVIADMLWHQIPHHSQNVELGAFVVMPNHVHGILIITEFNHHIALNVMPDNVSDVMPDNVSDVVPDNVSDVVPDNVETGHALSLRTNDHLQTKPTTIGQQRFQNIGKNSISSIIGSYKSAVTKHAHRLGFQFAWQTRFHDHVIRNDKSFQTISNYIINNPSNWQEDKFYRAE